MPSSEFNSPLLYICTEISKNDTYTYFREAVTAGGKLAISSVGLFATADIS